MGQALLHGFPDPDSRPSFHEYRQHCRDGLDFGLSLLMPGEIVRKALAEGMKAEEIARKFDVPEEAARRRIGQIQEAQMQEAAEKRNRLFSLMTTRTNYPAKFGVMMATGLLAYRRQVHVSGGQNGAAAWNKMLELSSLQGQGGNEFHEFLTNSLHGLHEAFKPLSWCLKHPDFRLRLSEIVKVLDDVCTESSKKNHGFQYLADLANEMLRHVRQ